MTADRIYADPSALLKFYRMEAESQALARWRFHHPEPLPLTLHGELEVWNGIELFRHRKALSAEAARDAAVSFEENLAQGRYRREDPGWRAVLRRAMELTHAHTAEVGTRTLDVMHVASALELGMKNFLTFDERQAELARRAGLRLVSISPIAS